MSESRNKTFLSAGAALCGGLLLALLLLGGLCRTSGLPMAKDAAFGLKKGGETHASDAIARSSSQAVPIVGRRTSANAPERNDFSSDCGGAVLPLCPGAALYFPHCFAERHALRSFFPGVRNVPGCPVRAGPVC